MIPDACPRCHPGIPPAALPGPDGTYCCSACGTRWRTTRDRHGWPIARTVLLEALAEQRRERKHAA